jgi:hypothetical protein
MNGTGNNGNGRGWKAIKDLFLSPHDLDRKDATSVRVCRTNYLSHLKSSGGI